MRHFDHERAHKEIAAPLFHALPARVHRLIGRVNQECAELHQDENLDMPWPEGNLRAAFEALDTNTLAEASRAVHDFGHWGTRSCLQSHGTYWKFSHYCDQVLRERLGLSRKPDQAEKFAQAHQHGVSFGIQEGSLHAYWSSSRAWLNREIGTASKGLLRAAEKSWGGCWCCDRFEHQAEKFAQAHPCGDLSDYMVER